MAVKKGLGKGLSGLIPTEPTSETENKKKPAAEKNVSRETLETGSAEVLIGINEIEPNQEQPRKKFEEDALQELSDSIRQFGVIQPILLQKKGKRYEIIAGERRWRAARLAGLKKVPAIIRDYSEQEIVEISLIENIQRENLNPIEEAVAYQRLMKEFQLKQDEIAERVSKSRTAITNSMRLLKLDLRVQEMLVEDLISSGHARAILGIEDGETQYVVAQQVLDHKMSVREVEKLVKSLGKPKKKKEEMVSSGDEHVYRELEEKMKQILGSKVSIQRKTDQKGKIEIEYYSMDELERIYELLNTI